MRKHFEIDTYLERQNWLYLIEKLKRDEAMRQNYRRNKPKKQDLFYHEIEQQLYESTKFNSEFIDWLRKKVDPDW